jgi:hypothetical protein
MNTFRLFIFFYIGLLCCSCDSSVSSIRELQQFIDNNENGLLHRVDKDGIVYEMSYYPSSYVIMQNHGDGLTESTYDSLKKVYQNFAYFKMRVTRNGKDLINTYANSAAFDEIVNYVTTGIGNDVSLVISEQKIPAYDFISTRAYEASSATEILFVFNVDVQKPKETLSLRYNAERFGSGEIQFDFNPKDIRSLPILALNERL